MFLRLQLPRVADKPELGLLLGGDRNEIAANRLARNGEGIGMTGDGNAITRNHIFESGFAGIDVDGGDDNLIAHNKIRGASRDGIIVGLPFALHGEANKVIGNRVRGAGRDGIHVGKKFTDTLLRRNHISGAGDDGIDARLCVHDPDPQPRQAQPGSGHRRRPGCDRRRRQPGQRERGFASVRERDMSVAARSRRTDALGAAGPRESR